MKTSLITTFAYLSTCSLVIFSFNGSANAGEIRNTTIRRNTRANYDLTVKTQSNTRTRTLQTENFYKIDASGDYSGVEANFNPHKGINVDAYAKGGDPAYVAGGTNKVITRSYDETNTLSHYGEWGSFSETELTQVVGAN